MFSVRSIPWLDRIRLTNSQQKSLSVRRNWRTFRVSKGMIEMIPQSHISQPPPTRNRDYRTILRTSSTFGSDSRFHAQKSRRCRPPWDGVVTSDCMLDVVGYPRSVFSPNFIQSSLHTCSIYHRNIKLYEQLDLVDFYRVYFSSRKIVKKFKKLGGKIELRRFDKE